MAKLQTDRKWRRFGLWLLLGLSALIVGYGLVSWWRGDARGSVSDAGGTVGGFDGAVGEYLIYVENKRARQAVGPAHEYAADALRRLATALGEVSARNARPTAATRDQLDVLRAYADSLQRNPQSTEHARYARDAFRAAASVMRTIQERHYPEPRYSTVAAEVAQVRFAAEFVLTARRLLEQTPDVQRFLDQAATALRAMVAGA